MQGGYNTAIFSSLYTRGVEPQVPTASCAQVEEHTMLHCPHLDRMRLIQMKAQLSRPLAIVDILQCIICGPVLEDPQDPAARDSSLSKTVETYRLVYKTVEEMKSVLKEEEDRIRQRVRDSKPAGR